MSIEVTFPAQQAQAARQSGFWLDRTLLDDFDRNLAARAGHTAVSGYNSMLQSEFRLTTAELAESVRRIASGLLRLGIERGDVISAQLPSWWQMIALHLATLRLGAVFNPLMPIFRERELEFMLGLAESKVLVVPQLFRNFDYAAMLDGLRPALPRLKEVLVIGADGRGSFERLLEEGAGNESESRDRRARPDEIIQLLYTSGTTGEPKGVMHTSNTLMANLSQHVRIQGLNESDVTLMASPLAHQTGFLYGIMAPIMTGGRVVLQDIWAPDEAVTLIERETVTFSIGSTPFLSDLLESASRRPRALRSLKVFVAAGAPIPRHLVGRAAEEFGVTVCSMWGMSENGPSAFTRSDDPSDKTLQTDGRAAPGMDLRVVDDAGHDCVSGTDGRLVVRGAGMFVGYLKRPELAGTSSDGWFDTGDLARMDPDGYIRITGRSKDVIIRGGENIPVVEIENMIYQHPAVAEAAIVAMPDRRLNERACAFVVLRPGQELTLSTLTKYLVSKKCSKTYLPERLEVVTELPRTPSGKIQKFRLREMARTFVADA